MFENVGLHLKDTLGHFPPFQIYKYATGYLIR